MLMNCKRKIHEKLVFENAPQKSRSNQGYPCIPFGTAFLCNDVEEM